MNISGQSVPLICLVPASTARAEYLHIILGLAISLGAQVIREPERVGGSHPAALPSVRIYRRLRKAHGSFSRITLPGCMTKLKTAHKPTIFIENNCFDEKAGQQTIQTEKHYLAWDQTALPSLLPEVPPGSSNAASFGGNAAPGASCEVISLTCPASQPSTSNMPCPIPGTVHPQQKVSASLFQSQKIQDGKDLQNQV